MPRYVLMLALVACEEVPAPAEVTDTAVPTEALTEDQTETEPEVEPAESCFDPGMGGAGFDATGEPCPGDASPIAYSLLGPQVHLVVDGSGSMRQEGRWEALLGLTPYLPLVGARANLGLSVFPDPEGDDRCGVGEPLVPVQSGLTAADAVAHALAGVFPNGRTPLAASLARLDGDPALSCPNRDNVVVLLSDGAESCDGDPEAAAAVLADQGIEVFVVGFALSSDADERALMGIAEAARASTAGDNYFPVSSAEELVARLAAVTGTCTAQLDADVAPVDLTVHLDGAALAPCTEVRCPEGYTYDRVHRTVTLEGSDCLALQDGSCHELAFDAR